MNYFEDKVNRRVNIQEDIKRYQDTLNYASSKVHYRVGENIYMLPSDMNLKIRSGTVGYNNKILVSDGKFSLGKNEKVNAGFTKPGKVNAGFTKPEKVNADFTKPEKETTKMTTIHKVVTQKPIITHEEERAALILFLIGGFTTWFMFR